MLDELVEQRPLDEKPLRAEADLPAVRERRAQRALDGLVQIGIADVGDGDAVATDFGAGLVPGPEDERGGAGPSGGGDESVSRNYVQLSTNLPSVRSLGKNHHFGPDHEFG